MSLTGTRDYYKPFDHPWMFDYYVQQNQMHWFPEDVPLHNDVKDWQDLEEHEKNLLTQIFRLFTQSDVDVSTGYVDRYMRIFRKPEAVPQIVDDCLAKLKGLKTIWMQIGIKHERAALKARQAGLNVIENRCPKIEHQRLFGELRKAGFATNIISSRL